MESQYQRCAELLQKQTNPIFLQYSVRPGKMGSGKKKVTGIDSFDKGVVKRCVHNFHNTEKELPTVKGILKKLKSDIHFQGSATSVKRILKDLGFQWRRTENNRKLLIEQTNIRLKRIDFFRKNHGFSCREKTYSVYR